MHYLAVTDIDIFSVLDRVLEWLVSWLFLSKQLLSGVGGGLENKFSLEEKLDTEGEEEAAGLLLYISD